MTTEMKCQNCKHSAKNPMKEGTGKCQRFPPTVVVDSDGDLVSVYPAVRPDWVCGEFELPIPELSDRSNKPRLLDGSE